MMKTNYNIIDSVSANELLKALNILHKINQTQPDPSTTKLQHHHQNLFSYQAQSRPQQPQKQSKKVIDFDLYMMKKNNNKQPKHQIRKSISPLKQINQNYQNINLNSIKSRSHSPIIKKVTQKPTIKKQRQKQNQERKVLKQKKQNIIKNNQNYQASFQSKKILDQKQKKGMAYVPIQFRTQQLMKQKQMKIAKLQKQKQISQILKEKEYTFRPTLIKSKRIKVDSKYLQNIQNKLGQNYKQKKQEQVTKLDEIQQQKQFKSLQCFIQQKKQDKDKDKDNDSLQDIQQIQQSRRYDSFCQKNQFLATQQLQMRHQNESTQYLFPNYKAEEFKPKKYKNQKFNFLLDLIH